MKPSAFTSQLVLAGIVFAASPALAEEGGGLPQLDTSTYPSQLFWLAVCFVVLYLVMWRISLPRVGETLENRRVQKDGDLAAASASNEEAEKVKVEYERMLAKARSNAVATVTTAERSVSAKLSEEEAAFADKARKRLTEVEQNIAKAKTDALKSVSDIAAEIAAGMVEKIAEVQVNKADAQKAVTAAMKKG